MPGEIGAFGSEKTRKAGGAGSRAGVVGRGAQGGRGEGGELAGSGAGRGGGAGAQAGRRNARRAGGAGGRAIATMRTRGAEKYTPFPSE